MNEPDRLLLLFLADLVRRRQRLRFPFAYYADRLCLRRLDIKRSIERLRERELIQCKSVAVSGVKRCQIRITKEGWSKVKELNQ